MEVLGMATVVVSDGKIVEMRPPVLGYCPMFNKMRNIETIDEDAVRQNIEFRIRDFGLFTEDRVVRAPDIVTFGVSEILNKAIRDGKIDAAVIVADGCGSAVVTDPEVLQGLCGRISGIIETSPLNVVLDAVGRDNVVDPRTTPIDQAAGAALAFSKGFRKFAVTVSRPLDALAIRKAFGDSAVIVGVHTSTLNRKQAEMLFDNCDFTTACASGPIREIMMSRKDVLIAGNKVQIVAITDFGKDLVGSKLESLGKTFWDGTPERDDPRPLL